MLYVACDDDHLAVLAMLVAHIAGSQMQLCSQGALSLNRVLVDLLKRLSAGLLQPKERDGLLGMIMTCHIPQSLLQRPSRRTTATARGGACVSPCMPRMQLMCPLRCPCRACCGRWVGGGRCWREWRLGQLPRPGKQHINRAMCLGRPGCCRALWAVLPVAGSHVPSDCQCIRSKLALQHITVSSLRACRNAPRASRRRRAGQRSQ